MKKTADDVKKEQSLSFMYFNRFLMLRYFTAFMFFTNLYWFGMALTCKSWSAVLPFLLMIGGIAVTLELTSKLHTKKSTVPVSKGYYIAQISVNLAIILISMTPAYSLFLPFLNGKSQFYASSGRKAHLHHVVLYDDLLRRSVLGRGEEITQHGHFACQTSRIGRRRTERLHDRCCGHGRRIGDDGLRQFGMGRLISGQLLLIFLLLPGTVNRETEKQNPDKYDAYD